MPALAGIDVSKIATEPSDSSPSTTKRIVIGPTWTSSEGIGGSCQLAFATCAVAFDGPGPAPGERPLPQASLACASSKVVRIRHAAGAAVRTPNPPASDVTATT